MLGVGEASDGIDQATSLPDSGDWGDLCSTAILLARASGTSFEASGLNLDVSGLRSSGLMSSRCMLRSPHARCTIASVSRTETTCPVDPSSCPVSSTTTSPGFTTFASCLLEISSLRCCIVVLLCALS